LVSGAICNSLNKYKPVKLQGRPIILTGNDKLRMFNRQDVGRLKRYLGGIFRKKPDVLRPLLGQIDMSVNHQGATSLGSVTISRYLHSDNTKPVIITWSGLTDIKILRKLRITGIKKILDITNYSVENNNIFSLLLTNVNSNKLIYSEEIGYVNKNGRILSLKEMHGLICKEEHEITYCHDPVTDVILTKCIFNYIINKITPKKLFKLCR
jgi:hypothetical protein